MPHLALYTFGVLKVPFRDPDPLMQEFSESVQTIYAGIDQTPGYLGHAAAVDASEGAHFDWDWAEAGEFIVPTWYRKGRTAETTALAATLSFWTDLRSATDFVYTGIHRVALNRRYDWFEKTGRPGLVFWWADDTVSPTWQDGVTRLEYLDDHEPAPHAFTFHTPFNPGGTPAWSGPMPQPSAAPRPGRRAPSASELAEDR